MTENIIENLIKIISKLPSLGPRSAKRIVLHLLENPKISKELTQVLRTANEEIKTCKICGNLSVEEFCKLCNDKTRNQEILCIVEDIADLWAIEKTKVHKGIYHILNGNLSAVEGRNPEDLNIENLLNRIENKQNIFQEIIIATNPTVEGQTTAYYIVELLKNENIKITKPAYGIPIGGEFNYLDESTVGIAFKSRKEFRSS